MIEYFLIVVNRELANGMCISYAIPYNNFDVGGEFMLLKKIKALCSNHNITISQLEKELNFGNGTVHKWYKSEPSAQKVLKVALYFNVSLDYLFDGNTVLKESI